MTTVVQSTYRGAYFKEAADNSSAKSFQLEPQRKAEIWRAKHN